MYCLYLINFAGDRFNACLASRWLHRLLLLYRLYTLLLFQHQNAPAQVYYVDQVWQTVCYVGSYVSSVLFTGHVHQFTDHTDTSTTTCRMTSHRWW